jgi:L-amino acid N-acyltransferase
VEHTIHVREDHWGSGVGRRLMSQLLESAQSLGKHVMEGAVTGENEASIRFHERLGFVEVARMPQVGAKFGRWLDLVLLQKRLDERESPHAAR